MMGVVVANETLSGVAEVRSDRLEVDHERRRARFEGNVKATYRSLKLECKEMVVSYDEFGEVTELFAKGQVIVRSKEAVARANSARLDAGLGLLVLEGNPTLVRGPNRLEGSRIEITLSSGRLDVIDARGTFKIGQGEN
jgi:lipopolysaccharide transport protein LptA